MLSNLELLQKYDVPGPRYTSYPTVPAWTETVNSSDYTKSLAAVKNGESLSLYFHLPFCEKLCHFCGCFKIITPDHSRSLPYVKTLIEEIDLVLANLKNCDKTVSQVHFGGGTPNYLQPAEMRMIMEKIRKDFNILPDAEIAIEMHPRTSTRAFCEEIAKLGFNRISLGVQDFDENVQKLINRHQTFEMTRDMIDLLRALGFASFNFDLIYGLPGQTLEKFKHTLELTSTLDPDRLAVYSYAHVPWKSPVQRSFKDEDLPTPELKLKLFEAAHDFFTSHGFEQIGMDHFAKKSDELFSALQKGGLHRNFMGYSTRGDAHQIGFGISSISYVAGNYFQNSKSVEEYENSIKSKKIPIIRGYILNDDDQIRRDLITEIMCRFQIDKKDFGARHGLDFDSYFVRDLPLLKGFMDDGLVAHDAKSLVITKPGKLTLRNVAMIFDKYLEDIRKTSRNPVFSRTV